MTGSPLSTPSVGVAVDEGIGLAVNVEMEVDVGPGKLGTCVTVAAEVGEEAMPVAGG